jgi:Bacterial Ig-like domain
VQVTDAIREQGRAQGRAEVQRDFFGQAAVRLTSGLFATALAAAAQQIGSYSPLAAQFYAAKAREFQAFATPPSVVSTSPAQDAANVAADDQVVLGFAVPMDETTLTPEHVYIGAASGGQHLNADYSYDPATRALTIKPQNPLSPGVQYRVTVTAQVQSESGQPMQTDYTMTFTTAA